MSENIGELRQSETVRHREVACADFRPWSGAKRTRISFCSRESPMLIAGSVSRSKAPGFTTFRGIMLLSARGGLNRGRRKRELLSGRTRIKAQLSKVRITPDTMLLTLP